MSGLGALVLQYGFLVLLWIFVFLASRTVVTDMYGNRARRAKQASRAAVAGSAGGAVAPPAVARELVVTRGALSGSRFPVSKKPITIGRGSACTVVIDDEYASTQHARLSVRDGQWVVEDLGSTNGTLVGRTRVTGPTPAPLGTPIQVGQTLFELRS